ncbi:SDR family oxidoreductase [Alcaligenaceae bacterium]|nr:SDR family oxidoreductase [Alcaligenaceae bacterium]
MTYKSIYKETLFDNSVVAITGGGSGIGRCTAHELASLGANLALIGRNQEKLDNVRSEIINSSGNKNISVHICDIRNEDVVKETVANIISVHGKLNGLFNNAGGQFPAPLKDISANGWDAVVRNNLTGGFLFARECYKQWMESNGGSIVNIIADMWNGMPGMGHSGAARAGMLNFTETAACEWAVSGVRVNAVAPGWIASSGLETYSPEFQKKITTLSRHVPLQRLGTESEVSAAAVFLLSEAAAFITGSTIRVDGGVPNARHTWHLPEHDKSKAYNGFHLSTTPTFLS